MALTAAVGAVALVIAAPTSAYAPPVAGCPASWSQTTGVADGVVYQGGLFPVAKFGLISTPRGSALPAQPGDLNNDGYICVRFIHQSPGGPNPTFVFTDTPWADHHAERLNRSQATPEGVAEECRAGAPRRQLAVAICPIRDAALGRGEG